MENVVQQSTDYDQFTFMSENRTQYRGHIEKLKQAFEEIGNLTKVQPILVNDKYEIIDGQHRFVACKELGQPIFFTVVPGLGVEEARRMNILHRNWNTNDYAQSYAASGMRAYEKYLHLKEEYEFSHSIMLAYIYNRVDRSGVFKEFRNGDLVIDNEGEVRANLDKLSEVSEYTPLFKNREFALAFLRLFKNPEYNHKTMMRKLKLHADVLKRYGSVEDNLRQLEELYNYGTRAENRVRLY